jgi:phosphoenolpyruvate-protein kinase (PTS system EI component)
MTVLAEGYNAFETPKSPTGVVKYLGDPTAVIALISSGKLQDHIILAQGGTTTFLSPALTMGCLGVITLSGAPESHLGILSREFQIPCIMTAYQPNTETRYVTGGNNDEHFKQMIAALDGKKVRLKCDHHDVAQVLLED